MQQLLRNIVRKSIKPFVIITIPVCTYNIHKYITSESNQAKKIYKEIQDQNKKASTPDYLQSSFEKNLRMYLNRNIVETLKEKEVREGGVEYLNQIIRQKLVIDAILDVLLYCIKDKEFIDEAIDLGNNIL